jgi:glycosyltransferase involved in cell wall biosynthesis
METVRKTVVCIPTYQTGDRFHETLSELSNIHSAITIYDDGSIPKVETQFNLPILRSHENLGKGSAIKAFLAREATPSETESVVFCDSDGQHHPEDIKRIFTLSQENPDRVYLGVRDFSRSAKVPFRNHFGNTCMRILFYVFFQVNLKDTQTGLRAIPRSLFGPLSKLPSNRFDYEIRQLCYLVKKRVPIIEVPIKTIYFPGNPSHFRSLRDSFYVIKALISEYFSP